MKQQYSQITGNTSVFIWMIINTHCSYFTFSYQIIWALVTIIIRFSSCVLKLYSLLKALYQVHLSICNSSVSVTWSGFIFHSFMCVSYLLELNWHHILKSKKPLNVLWLLGLSKTVSFSGRTKWISSPTFSSRITALDRYCKCSKP